MVREDLLSPADAKVLAALREIPTTVPDLVKETGLKTRTIREALYTLTVSGLALVDPVVDHRKPLQYRSPEGSVKVRGGVTVTLPPTSVEPELLSVT